MDWLRGYQVSDENGEVTLHDDLAGLVHQPDHPHPLPGRLTLEDSSEVNFTSQLFFDETENAAVLATSAYQKSGSRVTTNASDSLYDASLLFP